MNCMHPTLNYSHPPFCQKAGRAHIIEICIDPHPSCVDQAGSVDRLDANIIIRSGSHMMEKRWQMAMSYQEIRVRAAWMEQRRLHRTSVGRCRFFLLFFLIKITQHKHSHNARTLTLRECIHVNPTPISIFKVRASKSLGRD